MPAQWKPFPAIRTRGFLVHAGLPATLLRVAKSSSLRKSVSSCSLVFVETAELEHIQLVTGVISSYSSMFAAAQSKSRPPSIALYRDRNQPQPFVISALHFALAFVLYS
jgi:hypothetical protein